MEDVLFFATTLAFIVVMFMEMLKQALKERLQVNLIPVVAFVVGLGVGAMSYPFTDLDLVLRLWSGGIAGWMASGIYENYKKIKQL